MQLKWQLLAFGLFLLFSAQAQNSIKGKVVDTKNQALANVAVVLIPGNQGQTTNDQGNFSFDNLSEGTYTLLFSSLGYASQELKIPNSETTSSLNITLQPTAYAMDEMIVQATRAKEKTPMAYTNVGKEDLETQNLGQDIPFLLRWTPSAIVTSDAGAGIGYTGIRIRGTDPSRINVTINGIPLNDSESQGVFWVNMPDFASSTESVQVQRGVGTSSNGAGAFGATINLNTGKVKEEASASVNTSVGSFNTFRRNIQFGTGVLKDRFSIEGRLSKINSDGYIDRASSDLTSYYLSGAYLGDRTMLRFNTFSGHEITYQAWNGVPADLIESPETRTFNSAGLEKPGEPYENEVDNYRQTHYQMHLNHQFAANVTGNLSFHYTQGEGYFEQYKADQDLNDYGFSDIDQGDFRPDLVRRLWLDNDFYGTVFSLNINPSKFDFTLGGGYNIYEGRHFGEIIWSELATGLEPEQPYYDNDARKTDFNLYGKLSYPFSTKLEGYLDLQVRQVGYEFLGFDLNGNNVTQDDQLTFFNPKFGFFYDFGKKTSAYASFGVANREPNRNDYVESSPSSRPRPERLYDTELGFSKNWDKAAFTANAYYMYYRDQLALNGQLNDVGAFTRTNIDESYRLGLELNAGFQLSNAWRLDAGGTLSQNKVVAFDEFLDVYLDDGGYEQALVQHEDTDLSFSPSVIASLGLTWSPLKGKEEMENMNLDLSLLSKYVGQQYLDNTSDETNVLDPYFFSDLRIDFTLKEVLTKEIGITFLVQNVFDALYETNGWSYRYRLGTETVLDRGYYPQASRNFLLGLNLKF
ncbi:MAG: TonB-dependent receptor [Saprospiraceae bacterium]